jgi:signal transduction histidine kinase
MFAVAALGWLVLARSYRRLREGEAMRRELAVREREVRESYEKLRELERSRAVAKERERLMRDMHDGTGGQLASALAVARGGGADPKAVVGILQEALDDLRLTIESLDPEARDVPSVLGMMRATLERRIVPAGLRLVWRVGEAGGDRALEPEAALHLIRIVQEAVTNTIKHAGARTVTIQTRAGPDAGFVVEMMDDGAGYTDLAKPGRGLDNMRARAQAMGGRVEVRSSEAGTVVSLSVPA